MSPARASCSTRCGSGVVGGGSSTALTGTAGASADAADLRGTGAAATSVAGSSPVAPGASTPGAVGRFSPGRAARPPLARATMAACSNASSPASPSSVVTPPRRRGRRRVSSAPASDRGRFGIGAARPVVVQQQVAGLPQPGR